MTNMYPHTMNSSMPNHSTPSTSTTMPIPNIASATIHTPVQEDFDTEAMQGTFQQFLADNIGTYVHIDFLIGTTEMKRCSGYVYTVGRSVVTLFDDIHNVFITCDAFSIKFVTFLLPGQHTPGVPSLMPSLSSSPSNNMMTSTTAMANTPIGKQRR